MAQKPTQQHKPAALNMDAVSIEQQRRGGVRHQHGLIKTPEPLARVSALRSISGRGVPVTVPNLYSDDH